MQFLLDLANAAVRGENNFQLAEVASFFLYALYAWSSQVLQAVETRFIGYSLKKITAKHTLKSENLHSLRE